MECWTMRFKPFFHYSNVPVEKMFWLIFVMLFALCVSAQAQQTKKIPRIGILEPGSTRAGTCNNGFRQGLRDLGYVERQNIVFESRYAESKLERLQKLASELAQLKPNVIWTHSPPLRPCGQTGDHDDSHRRWGLPRFG